MADEFKSINGVKYHLYLALPSAIRNGEKHYLITPDYCLIYTDKAMRGKKVKEIKDFSVLPSTAWEWLLECINQVRAAYLVENQREILKEAERFGNEFFASLSNGNTKNTEETGVTEIAE